MNIVFEYMEISKSLLTPLLAVIATVIIIYQYKLASLRWKLDLYDKRYEVYKGIMNVVESVFNYNEITVDVYDKFNHEVIPKEALFDKEVADFLLILILKNGELLEAKTHKEKEELRKWYLCQIQVIKLLFEPYLRITRK